MKNKLLRQLLMTSRYVFYGMLIQLVFAGVLIASDSEAQIKTVKEVFVDMEFRTATISQMFERIERSTSFKFSYYQGDVDLDYSMKVTPGARSVNDILLHISKEAGLRFRQVNHTINVIKNKKRNPANEIEIIIDGVTVTGKVISLDNEEPLPGVNIVVKGTSLGVVTDINGEYKIEVPSPESVLIFSFVGYLAEEVQVGSRSVIDMALAPDIQSLDEVVVVGYGTQRKQSLVSSVTSVRPEELKVSSSNLTTVLAGRIPGIISYQRSGEPGQDNSEFFIRGLGTFGAGKVDPLILIDGVESSSTDMARLQPDDIEAFSVLKDATAAAVYGARGANGVILINTKSGEEGKTKFQFRAENRVSTNTRNFKLADNIAYMRLANEAALTRDRQSVLPYSQSKIDHTIAGDDPLLYPNNDWIDRLIKDYTVNQSYNLSASGGGKRARFYVAGTYNVDNGVLKVDKLNNFNNNIKLINYSVRSNIDIQLTESLEGIIRVYGQFDDYNGPIGGENRNGDWMNGGERIFNLSIWSNPVQFPAVYPSSFLPYVEHPLFGGEVTGIGSTNLLVNPYAEMVKGYQIYKSSSIQPQLELKQDLGFLVPGLKVRTMAYLKRYAYFQVARNYNPFYYRSMINPVDGSVMLSVLNDGGQNSIGVVGTEYLNYDEGDKRLDSRSYMEAAINYEQTFGEKHAVSGMLIGIMSSFQTGNAGSVQSSLEQRNIGLSGRFTYGYDNRYLAEFNFGYNGSERFAENHRFGFFPSFGLAYYISNEPFFQPLTGVIDDLKLRGSYGFVGNDQIGDRGDRFFYLSNVNLNNGDYGARFGEEFLYYRPGVSISRYSNRNITWEKSEQINLGMDMTLFNTLDIVADAFRQTRYNILQSRSYIGSTMGLGPANPQANTGEVESKGIDLSLIYNKNYPGGNYVQIRSNFTYATSKILKYDENIYPDHMSYLYRKGHPVRQTFGYIAERLFVDDEEVANSPRQFGEYRGGDIKYRDMNGDGVITGTDQVAIGYPTTPEIVYGFGGTLGLGAFDISAFFQGSARTSIFINPRNIAPFVMWGGEQNGLLQAIADSHWSEDNRDLYAFWPRLSDHYIDNNTETSTWWLRNGAFLRLKSVEMGYNVPRPFVERLGLDNLRFYLSGTNLYVWSKFDMWDPEMGGNGLGYPIQSLYTIGALVNL